MLSLCRLSYRYFCALAVIAVAMQFSSALLAQEISTQAAAPIQHVLIVQPLITQPVDETQLTVLKGNTHPLARPAFDLGTAPATLPMQRMLLVLKRSPQQEAALRKLLDEQQSKGSPNYHRWLTPAQFGQQFGPSDSDMQTITLWLQSHGFQVGSTKGRSVLEFSGSASQVKEAFHTTIHKYIVKGEQHWANASDPSIPTALTPAVAGVLTLHNFLKKPQIHFSPQPVAAKLVPRGPGKKPQVTFPAQSGQPTTYALAPQDYAVIYNINPVYNVDNDGDGTTIAVVGRSNLYNGGADISDFFNVVGSANNSSRPGFSIVLDGPDPGDLGGGEEAEATLDSTWSGAIAPGATVDLVVSASTNTTDGIDLSELYIVENNLADIMTESFGSCEYYSTDSQVAGVNAVAEQAAAQGITYFVSAGDDGAEGCDDQDSETVATGPLSVNVLASTPYTVAVGGTQFNENGDDTKYWTSTAPIAETAISYIPEDVWNASCLSTTCGSNAGIWAGSGGVSSGNILSGGTFAGFPKPVWQTGFGDSFRDVPDVALTSAGHDPYLLCIEASCEPDSTGNFYIYFVWGTSAAAPSFAGIMGMVDQQATSRQGQADYVLYTLGAMQEANTALTGLCNGSSTSILPNAACVFNDVTAGNNAVPGEANYGLSNADYQAGVGYDMASGLGSVNVTNLLKQWNSAASKFNATTTTLTLNSSTTLVHGSPLSFTAAVAPTSATGTPTGDVALLISAFPVVQGVGFFTLTAGAVSSSISSLPGGTYALAAQYGGDSTFAGSTSLASPEVTVTPEASTTVLSVLTFNQNGNPIPVTSEPFGTFIYLRADVAGASGHGIPTGGVTFSDTFGSIPGSSNPYALNSQGNTATPNGVLTFDTGTHTISASYGGDVSFNASASSTLSFTIQPGFFAAVPSSQSQVTISAPGSSGSTSVAVAYSTGFSGTIALACSGLPAGAACVFSPASIKGNGAATTTNVSILVTTTAATAKLSPPPSRRIYFAQWLFGTGLLFSLVLMGAPKPRRARGVFLGLILMGICVVPGCGGGGSSKSSSTPPPAVSTPAGSYNVVVSATSGAATSSTGFALVVQ
ncbi:MAG: protease pro-enzyme activation domain-containing protein [Candidatus Sulfotelmatobacter sp.]